jgi:hypothetical protein
MQWRYPFEHPVDTKKYDNYLDFVKRPMDLSVIKKNLDDGMYVDPIALLLDVRQVSITSEPQCLVNDATSKARHIIQCSLSSD